MITICLLRCILFGVSDPATGVSKLSEPAACKIPSVPVQMKNTPQDSKDIMKKAVKEIAIANEPVVFTSKKK